MDEKILLFMANALGIPLPWKTNTEELGRLETVEGRTSVLFRLLWRRFIVELAEEIEHSRANPRLLKEYGTKSQREQKREEVGL